MSFIAYLFSLKDHSSSNSIINVDELSLNNEDDLSKDTAKINTYTKRKIVVTINRVLAIVCLVSFSIICYSYIQYPDRNPPNSIENIFMLTLGYYGSAFLTFFEIKK